MPPPFQADENFPLPVVRRLRAAGLEVLTATESGLVRTPDPAVLAAATAAGRVVLTQDNDFIRLHNRGVPHAGIVHVSQDHDVPTVAARIFAAVDGRSDFAGQLIRVRLPNPPR